ncbi:restriction endonuclease subunit S [Aeromicrobium marinum]|nr:restriction endonuclease subunit S [Aeromicrobium marinum]
MSVPLGRLVEINPSVPDFAVDPEREVTFVPLECVWPDGRGDFSRRASAGSVSNGYTVFSNGDVLLPKITPTFEAGRVAVAHLETELGAGTTELHVLRARPEVDPRFVSYLCRSQQFLQDGATRLQGVGNLRRVPAGFLSRYPVEVVEYSEQRAVADYLDRETVRIDTLIDEQQRLMEVLRERRRALRASIVSIARGSGEPTEETGLFWCPEIPPTWSVVPLTSVAELRSGHTPSRTRPELWLDCQTPWITLNDVGRLSESSVIAKTVNLISEAGIAASSAQVLPVGTVVLSRDATIGRSSIMGVPMATSQHFAAWICGDRLLPEYLWLLFTGAMQPYFDSLTNGSTLRTIGMSIIGGFRIPLPPVSEQVQIVQTARDQTGKIDELMAETARFIELSRERRSALITAAVTGQIDVRGAA